MKTFLFLLLSASAWGAKTTITQIVVDGSGQKVTGSCVYYLTSGRATAADGRQIVGERVTVPINAGAFTALVEPTDSMLPVGQSYTVTCTGSRQWSKNGYWQVPTSTPAVGWADVWVATVPSPSVMFLPAQITATGLATGTYCLDVVNGLIVGLTTCSGSGGSGALSLATLTDGQLASLTDGQLASLTN